LEVVKIEIWFRVVVLWPWKMFMVWVWLIGFAAVKIEWLIKGRVHGLYSGGRSGSGLAVSWCRQGWPAWLGHDGFKVKKDKQTK
jgi:hypothetical protein